MEFPSNSNQQFYKRLKRTYRSTFGILKFVKHMSTSKQIMYQFDTTTKDYDHGLDCIILDPMKDVEMKPNALPPPYKKYPIPVIWIRFCEATIKEVAQKLIDILQPLNLNNQTVPVLTNFENKD
jgi:hypothetical protein